MTPRYGNADANTSLWKFCRNICALGRNIDTNRSMKSGHTIVGAAL
jgi:hypothetical protein